MSYKSIEIRREKAKEYYCRNKTVIREYQKDYHLARQQIINELKNRPCMDCQGWFEPCQIEFDHRNPKTKLFCISNSWSRSIKALLAEVAKCDVVCSNCHQLRTWRYSHAV